MNVVIRPVNASFLEEIAFPIFEMGMVDAPVALKRLHAVLADDGTRRLLEVLLARGVGGALWSLAEAQWTDVMYRLLFYEWIRTDAGWQLGNEYPSWAGDLDRALHLALMIEHPQYPYWDATESQVVREACLAAPETELGLAAMLAGRWNPVPRFAPHEVLALRPNGSFKAGDHAIADWSFRDASSISLWSRQLDAKLGRLLEREQLRLRPLELFDVADVRAFWLGQRAEAPAMSIAFSGLGPDATTWIPELGALVGQLRLAAARDHGLTSIVTVSTDRALDELI